MLSTLRKALDDVTDKCSPQGGSPMGQQLERDSYDDLADVLCDMRHATWNDPVICTDPLPFHRWSTRPGHNRTARIYLLGFGHTQRHRNRPPVFGSPTGAAATKAAQPVPAASWPGQCLQREKRPFTPTGNERTSSPRAHTEVRNAEYWSRDVLCIGAYQCASNEPSRHGSTKGKIKILGT